MENTITFGSYPVFFEDGFEDMTEDELEDIFL